MLRIRRKPQSGYLPCYTFWTQSLKINDGKADRGKVDRFQTIWWEPIPGFYIHVPEYTEKEHR